MSRSGLPAWGPPGPAGGPASSCPAGRGHARQGRRPPGGPPHRPRPPLGCCRRAGARWAGRAARRETGDRLS